MLCIGDLMLDDFVYGEVSRMSPEAPVPVIAVKRRETWSAAPAMWRATSLALGARCIFVGVIGGDDAGRALSPALADHPRSSRIWSSTSRPTTRKVRFVSEHHSTHLLRADWELAAPTTRRARRR